MERRVLLQGWLGAGGAEGDDGRPGVRRWNGASSFRAGWGAGGAEGGDGRAKSLRRWNGGYSFRAGWAPAEPKATMGGLGRRWARRPAHRADDGGG
ncbi:MAG: hypothetical protein OXG35_31770, partial [Acidobacteria bacterium]|nr:hypothetical protein [Acidobacteriota bacterium]